MKKNIKIIFSVVVTILIILSIFVEKLIVKAADNPISVTVLTSSGNETVTSATIGKYLTFKSSEIFSKNPIYCIHSASSSVGTKYKVKEYKSVSSNTALAYILNLKDDYWPVGNGDITDWYGTKQNLIWYYLDMSSRKGDFGNISYTSKAVNSNILTEYYNAIAYENSVKNFSITAKKNGENVDVSWNNDLQLVTEFQVFINGDSLYQTLNKSIKEISIPLNKFTGEKAKVKVVAKNAKIESAGYYKLVSDDNAEQELVITAGKIGDLSDTDESIVLSTDVSLQKYITQVNGANLTVNETALTNRKNTYTTLAKDSNNQYIESNGDARKTVSKSEKNSMVSKNKYDSNNIVQIEVGDTVTYRVYVYNNSSSVAAKSIVIKDRMPYIENNGNAESLVDIKEIRNENGNMVTWTKDTSKDDSGNLVNKNTYQYTVSNLAAGKSTYFDITLTYKKYNTNILTNTAWISSTNPSNSKTYRTVDRDYVKMKEYKVSLEKFVTEVTDSKGNDKETYNQTDGDYQDRSGKRYNDEASTTENKNTYKPNNKVQVETGDIVTYTIRLKNTGDTNVKITQIYDSFDTNSNLVKLEYVSSYGIKGNGGGKIVDNNYRGPANTWSTDNLTRYLIQFDNAFILEPGKTTDVTIQFKVVVPSPLTNQSHILDNRACIVELKNKNNVNVDDGDGTDNNRDQDYVITKIYAVSLEKFVYKVNDYELCDFNNDNRVDNDDVYLMRKYISEMEISDEELDKIIKYGDYNNDGKISIEDVTELGRAIKNNNYSRDGYAEHNYDDDTSTNNSWKHNHVVTVSQGDKVTYKIKLKNDGATSVYITEVTDYLPDGVKYGEVTYSGGQYDTTTNNAVKFNGTRINGNVIIAPGGTATFEVSVIVTESNMSLNVLKNTARITEMKNRNIIVVQDTTPNNNEDADYLKLNHRNPPPPGDEPDTKDVIIAGMVWNDINPIKNNNAEGYNGLYQGKKGADDNEKKLAGVKVYLYRNGVNTAIATKTTDENGYYYFADIDIDEKVVTNPKERHIKGPIDSESNRWAGTYYAYYIVFEYDGITYTATPNGNTCVSVTDSTAYSNGTYKINSNAREDYGKTKKSRSEFNSKYSKVNNASGIDYKTLNENEYLPQSVHKYNSDMAIQSSTALIQLSNNSILEEEIKYINLGLRGRDSFDLELHSDVFSTRVKVNGQQGEYKYNSNRVDVRKSDMRVEEDAANVARESRTGTVSEIEQKVRETDIDREEAVNSKTVTKYSSTGLGIEVTYKITVTNISKTDGTATKIVNYYDNSYNFERAYYSNGPLSVQASDSGSGFNSVVITTQGTSLSRNGTMDIYVVYTLKSPTSTLKPLLNGTKMIPTFNMSEIYEYKTQCASGQTEYTRGLIDINSAPGSANKEQVRTTNTVGQNTPTTGGNPTTAQYYFNKKSNASILKYENDTCAAPTLYFTTDGERKLEGQVFEDKTKVNSERVRSGNGIKDSNENGVYGVTVILKEGNVERYKTTSDKNGNYSFEKFLPGNYTIEYRYGDTKKTVLQKQSGNVNAKSYNGEDYQSTNNSYDVKDIIVNKLNKTPNFWYVYNESQKVSVADDFEERRNTVSSNVSNFTAAEMINLNDIRAGKTVSDEVYNNIKNKTHMSALTNNFTLTVEKSVIDGNKVKQNNSYADYVVSGMNFGLAEVPVTTIDLQKHISKFTIKDSARDNVIASYDGTNKVGDVLPLDKIYDVSIEDEKLQGAKLEITFNVSAKTNTERDFRNKLESTTVTIDGISDFIDNDLLYNDALGENSKYWKVSSHAEIQGIYNKIEALNGEKAKGTVDPDGTLHTSIVIAKKGNPLLEYQEGKEIVCPITLEKVLSASNASLNDIITSSIMSYEYDNDVEILKLNYSNTIQDSDRTPLRDRVRTASRTFTILAGTQYDSASSETLAIHPPTGNNNNIIYYTIGVSALAILAAGVVLIKKYAIKKN